MTLNSASYLLSPDVDPDFFDGALCFGGLPMGPVNLFYASDCFTNGVIRITPGYSRNGISKSGPITSQRVLYRTPDPLCKPDSSLIYVNFSWLLAG